MFLMFLIYSVIGWFAEAILVARMRMVVAAARISDYPAAASRRSMTCTKT